MSPLMVWLNVRADRQNDRLWNSTNILHPYLLNVRLFGFRAAYFTALHLQEPAALGSTAIVQLKLFLLHPSPSQCSANPCRPACALCWGGGEALHAMQSAQRSGRPRVAKAHEQAAPLVHALLSKGLRCTSPCIASHASP